MRSTFVLAALLGAALSLPFPARAAGDHAKAEGATLRLAVAPPLADGTIRAALVVDLAPGWKTYWLDPGEAGIPPEIAASVGDAATLTPRFPAPHRFDDGFAVSTVYSAPFAVALEGSGGRGPVRLRVTLGLCRDICEPVAAELEAAPGGVEAEGIVAGAFAALPRESTAAEGIVGARLAADGSALELRVAPAALALGAELFAAGPRGWSFGRPEAPAANAEGGAATVRLPVTARPRKGPAAPPSVSAVLAGPQGAWGAQTLPVTAGK